MAKPKTLFYCQNCGAQASKWMGRCPSCGEWNTFVEEVVQRGTDTQVDPFKPGNAVPVRVDEIIQGLEERYQTGNEELDRVLGGGLVSGSVVLVGGEPGIGKSTLMLQVALSIKNLKVLYISGEESNQQI